MLVTADGAVRQVADGLAFPNGMAVTGDNQTLIVGESYAKRLTAYEIADDGNLANRDDADRDLADRDHADGRRATPRGRVDSADHVHQRKPSDLQVRSVLERWRRCRLCCRCRACLRSHA